MSGRTHAPTHPARVRLRRAAAALVAAGAIAAVAGPASADAAIVDFESVTGTDGKSRAELNYNAAAGENNLLRVDEVVNSDGHIELRLDDQVPIAFSGPAESNYCQYPVAGDMTVVQCNPDHFISGSLAGRWQQLNVRLGDGQNVLRSFSGSTEMLATGQGASSNSFDGGPGKDSLYGDLGRDILLGGAGDDTVHGIEGDDGVAGGPGNDTVIGGGGNDRLIGNAGADTFHGQAGNDTVSYSDRTNAVKVTIDDAANDGETGEADNVRSDVENVEGGNGNDEIVDLVGGANVFSGLGGDDRLLGGAGHDSLDGGVGWDGIEGGAGTDFLVGGVGFDALDGGSENDVLSGGNDGDSLIGGTGADDIIGGAGTDLVWYGDRTQRVTVDLDGAVGDDGASGEGDTVRTDVENIVGGAASDTLTGNAAANRIVGNDGNDVIEGGLGIDDLFGGNDNDTLRSKDGEADRVNCGADGDQVDADQIDTQTGCEAKAAPAVGIGPKRARVDDRGRAKLSLHCWASSAERCTGTLRLQRRVREKDRTLASRRFSVAAGDTAAVRVRLASRARRALARSSMKVRAVTWASDAAGHEWTSKRTLTLRR